MRCPDCGAELAYELAPPDGTLSCPNLCVSGVVPQAADPAGVVYHDQVAEAAPLKDPGSPPPSGAIESSSAPPNG